MDPLTFFVAAAHLKLRLERLRRHPDLIEEISMTPNVKGLGSALAKLKHSLDLQAGEALAELSELGQRGNAAMAKAKQKIADTRAAVEEIEAFVAEEGSNGGPSLAASSASSVTSDAGEPSAATQQLTVNGVRAG